jgi:malate dehydrogenase (oxaloacetate-decarboxylating)
MIGHLPAPSAQFSLTLRVELPSGPGGVLGKVTAAIGRAGGAIVAVDTVEAKGDSTLREITVECWSVEHRGQVISAVQAVRQARVVEITDRTFEAHRRGKIHTGLNLPVKTRDDLSMAYTPGVARVCSAIAENRQKAFKYTIKANTVAVVSDGTAVLGLGDIGPGAAMPVMEGKAMLFKELAGVDAFPLCLDTTDVDEIVKIVQCVAPTFGGVNLEDIAAPRCFEVERRLQETLDIPVFHDDQHGTAVVVLAALVNALKVVRKRAEAVRVVVVGAGAAGLACAKIILEHGVRDLVVCDIGGILHPDRTDLDAERRAMAERTNPRGLRGRADDALKGADVVIGVSAPGAFSAEAVRSMAPDAIVFAMANPNPEVQPEAVYDDVAIMATGRSDYPNQINNVLAFPGIFRGALDVRARSIDEPMKLAAARAIAAVIPEHDLGPEYIVPSVFNRAVSPAVAEAVAKAAIASGVARRDRLPRKDPA